MNISVASSSLVSVPVINAILESDHNLVSVISNPDRKAGRGQVLVANELAQWASERDLPLAKPADNSELNKHLLAAQPQLVVTVAYGKLIPVELLHGPRFGWLNVHFSLLPKYRGAAPVQWAIWNGEEETGITIFKLDKGMDTGPIYLKVPTPLGEKETTSEVLERLSQDSGQHVLEVIQQISKAVRPIAQPLAGATLAPKITKEMGVIDWGKFAIEILRQYRAIGERPGTFTNFRGERLLVHEMSIASDLSESAPPGSLLITGDNLAVRCLDSWIEIREVTPAGKKRMAADDFVRGARITNNERFE
ncbi:MAG: methionyl-tRNA formyltransferase [Actinomycetes bacterium]